MPPAVGGMKECAVCAEVKPTSEYNQWATAKDGLNSRCKICASAENRKYRLIHREKVLAGKKLEYTRNRERRIENSRAWRAANQERHQYLQRRSWLKLKYSMTPEEYAALLVAQGGTCALCDRAQSPDGRQLSVDHDHDCCPGKTTCGECVRGLLCSPCNRLLGWLDARRELVDAYLTNYEAKRN